jgi:hypothetical protein
MVRPEAPLPDLRPRHVMLANAGRARLLGRDPDKGALRELADFVNPRARLKASALDRERPGRSALGSRRTAYEPPTEHAERDLPQLALHLREPRLRQLLAPGPAPGRAA